MADQELKSSALELEKAIIKGETCAIVDKCFELGMGDLALGAIRGVKAGVLDIPFAPSKYNAGKMLPARDFEGAEMCIRDSPLSVAKRAYEVMPYAEVMVTKGNKTAVTLSLIHI